MPAPPIVAMICIVAVIIAMAPIEGRRAGPRPRRPWSRHHRIQDLPMIRLQASIVGRGHAPAALGHDTTG